MSGHIVFIGQPDRDSEVLADWTVHWILANEVEIEPSLYICADLEIAQQSLTAPLAFAQPPSLVIINHTHQDPEYREFSHKVRTAIPECWVVDLIFEDFEIEENREDFQLFKPVSKEDWEEFLKHLFKEAHTPQYSKALENPQ